MEIPKRIENLIDKRWDLAERLNSADAELCEWMEQQGMNLLEMTDFTRTGCMMYCEPATAAKLTRDAIENYTLN